MRKSKTVNSINIYNDAVLGQSAANLPYATNEPVHIYPNEFNTNAVNRGSTHIQVRNDDGLKDHLNKLFDGQYEPFFWTNEK
jgi:hypothetical protein